MKSQSPMMNNTNIKNDNESSSTPNTNKPTTNTTTTNVTTPSTADWEEQGGEAGATTTIPSKITEDSFSTLPSSISLPLSSSLLKSSPSQQPSSVITPSSSTSHLSSGITSNKVPSSRRVAFNISGSDRKNENINNECDDAKTKANIVGSTGNINGLSGNNVSSGSRNVGSNNSNCKLFKINLKHNSIHFPSVALTRNRRFLHKFSITNLTSNSLLIDLQSDLNGDFIQDSSAITPITPNTPSPLSPSRVITTLSPSTIKAVTPSLLSPSVETMSSISIPPSELSSSSQLSSQLSSSIISPSSSSSSSSSSNETIELDKKSEESLQNISKNSSSTIANTTTSTSTTTAATATATNTTTTTTTTTSRIAKTSNINNTDNLSVTFQLSNENLVDQDFNDETFTFNNNQVFNSINTIEKVTLKPKESREIVIGFLPQPKPTSTKQQKKVNYNYFPVKGQIIITANEIIKSKRKQKGQYQKTVLTLSANVCKSYLDISSDELDFGDCIPNQQYNKYFTVWNRSEIPLSFTLSLIQCLNRGIIEFANYETGESVSSNISIPGHSHMEISVIFKPFKIGEYNVPVFVHNNNDEDNIKTIRLSANIVSQQQEDGLVLLNSKRLNVRSLEFGDCYTGSRCAKTLIIKNMSSDSVDITFESDCDKSCLDFELLSELQDSQQLQSSSPPSSSTSSSTSSSNNDIYKKKMTERIEELVLSPGDERMINVWYSPEYCSEIETELVEKKFKIFLKCFNLKQKKSYYSKMIHCTARVCTSIIEVSPTKINFGDSNIGLVKYAIVRIKNRSELPAKIAIKFNSKVITCKTKEAIIPPKQIIEIKLRLSPRKVNPSYRKQITIENLYNKEDDRIIEIQSNNIDKNKIILHSLFYDVHTTSQHNFAKNLDFDIVVANNLSLRGFSIRNINKEQIKLALTSTSPKEIKILIGGPSTGLPTFINNFMHLLEKVGKSSKYKSLGSPTSDAISSKSLQPCDLHDFLDILSSSYELFSQKNYSPDDIDEIELVNFIVEQKKMLEKSIKEGLLVDIEEVMLNCDEEKQIYVLFHPSTEERTNLSSTLKKVEEKLFIKLIDYDHSILEHNMELPPRELVINAKLCLSMMGITQKNINFGNIMSAEEKRKILTISNMSEISLIYKILKSSSIASDDLEIGPSIFGIIRAYGSRDIHLRFKPSLAGKFEEKINIENIQDYNDSKTMVVKAIIEKLEKFSLKTTDISFGTVHVGGLRSVKRVVITNTTKHRRVFELKYEFKALKGCSLEFDYDFQPCSSTAETEKLEAELEKIEHKYRIAVRKQKTSKITKLKERIEEIKKVLSFGNDEDDSYMLSSEEESNTRKKRFKKIENGIRFAIPGNATQVINITMKAVRNSKLVPDGAIEKGSGRFIVYESKNTDSQKKVAVTFQIQYPTASKNDNASNQNASTLPKGLDKPIPNSESKDIPLSSLISSKNSHSVSQAAPPLLKPATLIVSPSEIDLGRVTVGESTKFKMRIHNSSSHSSASFSLLTTSEQSQDQPMKISLSVRNATLSKKETIIIDVTCEPQYIGPQRHKITVQNISTKQNHTVLIICNPHTPPPVRFPDLMSQRNNELDFGNCFLDSTKKYSKVIPFIIENKKDIQFTFDVTSNSPNQVLIFQDEELTQVAHDVKLLPMGTCVLHVCLKPYLSEVAKGKGHCRIFVGGLRVKVFDEKHSLNIYEKVIPFKTLVGYSILECSTTLINFGCTDKLNQTLTGKFVIHNRNMHLPLVYEIKPVSSQNLWISSHEGRMDPVKGKSKSSKVIQFSLTTQSYGLNDVVMKVINKMCLEKQIKVHARVFVDEKILSTNLKKKATGIDYISFGSIYTCLQNNEITVMLHPELQSALFEPLINTELITKLSHFPNVRLIRLKNTSREKKVLVLESECNLQIITENGSTSVVSEQLAERMKCCLDSQNICSGEIELNPNQDIALYVVLKGLPQKGDMKNVKDALYSKKKIHTGGTLMIHQILEKESNVIKIVDIDADACVSEGALEFPTINVGKFGHVGGWKSRRFQFTIQNTSDIPLVMKIVSKTGDIGFLNIGNNNVINVPPLKACTVDAIFQVLPLKGQAPGIIQRDIQLFNIYNPSNRLEFTIQGQLSQNIWKSSLQERNKIIQPLLEIPPRPDFVPCDSSFNLVNTSQEVVYTKFLVEVNPEVSGLLKIEVLNFGTNVPLKEYKFLPKGMIDLRVRCTALPDAYIPEKLWGKISKRESNSETLPFIHFGDLRIQANDQPTEHFQIVGSLFVGMRKAEANYGKETKQQQDEEHQEATVPNSSPPFYENIFEN